MFLGVEQCAVLLKSNKLNNVKCDELHHFVCKMDISHNSFQSNLSLSDHLSIMDKEIQELKVNLSKVDAKIKTIETSTQADD